MKTKKLVVIICVLAIFAVVGFWYAWEARTGYLVQIKTDLPQPQLYLAIYKNSKLIYRFAPVVPESVGYPRPLRLEKVQRIGPYLLTTWGETGADYFGTHPIVIKLGREGCKVVAVYDQDLSEDVRIENYSWTRKDFFVTNYFNPSEKVKTILTQGVRVTPDRQLELSFYADEQPHAADHQYAKIRVFALGK